MRRSLVVVLLVACGSPGGDNEAKAPIVVAVNDAAAPPPEPSPKKQEPGDHEAPRTRIEEVAKERDRIEKDSQGVAGDDPAHGNFAMVDATVGLAGTGPLVATIKTTSGDMTCKLFDDKAPISVANFVGLARGLRPFKDPSSGLWVKRPAYDGTTFHRVIKGFMIQGGDPKGNGTGEPGYVIPDERWAGGKHDRAGLLCAANRGANTNGMQFFITDAKTPHLDSPSNAYTIYGECAPTSVVSAIASVPKDGRDKPLQDVIITTITIARGAPAKPKP